MSQEENVYKNILLTLFFNEGNTKFTKFSLPSDKENIPGELSEGWTYQQGGENILNQPNNNNSGSTIGMNSNNLSNNINTNTNITSAINNINTNTNITSAINNIKKKIENINPKLLFIGTQETNLDYGLIQTFILDKKIRELYEIVFDSNEYKVSTPSSYLNIKHVRSILFKRKDINEKVNVQLNLYYEECFSIFSTKNAFSIIFTFEDIHFCICNAHLPFNDYSPDFSKKERIQKLICIFRNLADKHDNHVIILGGDLNFRTSLPTNDIKLLIEHSNNPNSISNTIKPSKNNELKKLLNENKIYSIQPLIQSFKENLREFIYTCKYCNKVKNECKSKENLQLVKKGLLSTINRIPSMCDRILLSIPNSKKSLLTHSIHVLPRKDILVSDHRMISLTLTKVEDGSKS
jgi:GTP cyclohydrolase III